MAKDAVKKIGLRATAGKRTLRFGMVAIGISLAPALDASTRVSGKYVDPDLLTPVKQQYVNENGEVVKPISAYPYGEQFVTLDTDDLAAVSTDEIELVGNIATADLPLEWIDSTYVAWPTDATHDAAYAMLADYLQRNGRAFIGKTVQNKTTKVIALRWSSVYGTVVAHTLAYYEQVRWANVEMVRDGVAEIPAPAAQMAAMADAAFAMVPDSFEWDTVTDEYGAALTAAIAEKAASGHVTPREAAPVSAAPDLMAALAASLAPEPAAKKKVKVKA